MTPRNISGLNKPLLSPYKLSKQKKAPMRTKNNQLPKEFMIDNILSIYYQSSIEEKHQGFEWYREASNYCYSINRMTGLDDYKSVCAVMAALSPNNRWERNIVDTHHIIQDWMLGVDGTSVGTYGANRQKAIDILELGSEHIDNILGGNKVNAFYHCIREAGIASYKLDYKSFAIMPCQLQAITWLTWRRIHNV